MKTVTHNDLEESWQDLHKEDPKPEPEPEPEPKMPSVEELEEFLQTSLKALSQSRSPSSSNPSAETVFALTVKYNYMTFEATTRSLKDALTEIVTRIMESIEAERKSKAEQRQQSRKRLQEAEDELTRSNTLVGGIQAPPMPKRQS